MASLPMLVLILVVGFLVLTPLFLMILNSFQTARPGQPIVWGMEGWIKAFTTPGIVNAMTNTFFTGRLAPPAKRDPWKGVAFGLHVRIGRNA